jgi:hypothetical protein
MSLEDSRPNARVKLAARVACVFLVLHLSACTTWRISDIAPQTVVATERPARVRVTRTDGSEVVLRGPSIRADSLYGLQRGVFGGVQGDLSVGIPLTDIRQLAVGRTDLAKSLGLAVVLFAVVAGGIVVIVVGGAGGD